MPRWFLWELFVSVNVLDLLRALSDKQIVGGLAVLGSKKLGHQRWQIVFFIALQTGCVGALSTSTIDNPVKSIILTVIVSMTTALVMLNCFVLVGFGIVDQNDM